MTHAETFAEKYDNVSSNIKLTQKNIKEQNITSIIQAYEEDYFIFFNDYSVIALRNGRAEVISPQDTFVLMMTGFKLVNKR